MFPTGFADGAPRFNAAAGSVTKTVFNPRAAAAASGRTVAAVRPQAPRQGQQAGNKASQRQKAMQMAQLELSNKKQQLLQENLEQQRKLIARLESKTLSAEDKKATITMVKAVAGSIERLQADLKEMKVTKPKPNQRPAAAEQTAAPAAAASAAPIDKVQSEHTIPDAHFFLT